jgi:hypothetical protein
MIVEPKKFSNNDKHKSNILKNIQKNIKKKSKKHPN